MSNFEFGFYFGLFVCLGILSVYVWVYFFVFLFTLGEWLRDRLFLALIPFLKNFLRRVFEGVQCRFLHVIWTKLAPTVEKTITEGIKLWKMFKGKFV